MKKKSKFVLLEKRKEVIALRASYRKGKLKVALELIY